tara:strand:- start:3178 stop:3618 length:441 start_codon:yes stop_codon:yes gene_type:complete
MAIAKTGGRFGKSVELEGLEFTVEQLMAIGNKIDQELEKILNEVGLPRVGKMQNRTPVENSDLKDNLGLAPVTRTDEGLEIAWVAGGPASAYALVQHEDLDFNHPGGGQSHFMSSVLYEDGPAMRVEIAEEIDTLIKKYSIPVKPV